MSVFIGFQLRRQQKDWKRFVWMFFQSNFLPAKMDTDQRQNQPNMMPHLNVFKFILAFFFFYCLFISTECHWSHMNIHKLTLILGEWECWCQQQLEVKHLPELHNCPTHKPQAAPMIYMEKNHQMEEIQDVDGHQNLSDYWPAGTLADGFKLFQTSYWLCHKQIGRKLLLASVSKRERYRAAEEWWQKWFRSYRTKK